MKITDRDIKIKEFLKVVGASDTNTLSIMFFNNKLRAAQKRLKTLIDNKYIKCFRPSIIEQNIYYVDKKPISYKHKIVFSKLLAELKQNDIDILKYKSPYKLNNVIADGIIVINHNNNIEIYFIEIERTKKLNKDKYIDLYYSNYWKSVFPIFPSILTITDKKINTHSDILNIKLCKYDLSNLLEAI